MTENDDRDYWELGFNLFSKEPELLGAAVWWRAHDLNLQAEDAYNFVFGYSTARRQRDDYQRERQDQADGGGNAVETGHCDLE
jgi:hypothetical protein